MKNEIKVHILTRKVKKMSFFKVMIRKCGNYGLAN